MNNLDDVKLLKDMVSIYSPTGETDKIRDFLVSWMGERGFDSKILDGNAVGIIGNDSGNVRILLVSHMDTVPGKIYIRQADGKFYGRGAVDAKGSLAAMVCAASRFAAGGKAKIIVVGVPDEEGLSLGARKILERFKGEVDYCINGEPSGWDSITIGYKGIVSFSYKRKNEQLHYSKQTPVAFDALDFISKLRGRFDSEEHTFHTSNVEVRKLDCDFSEVDAQISIRIPEGVDMGEIKDFVNSISGGADVKFLEELSGVLVDKKNKLVSALLNSMRLFGGDPSFKKKTGTSDMNILVGLGCPIVTYGPGDSKLDHTDNEHIDLDEFEKSVNVLENVIKILSE